MGRYLRRLRPDRSGHLHRDVHHLRRCARARQARALRDVYAAPPPLDGTTRSRSHPHASQPRADPIDRRHSPTRSLALSSRTPSVWNSHHFFVVFYLALFWHGSVFWMWAIPTGQRCHQPCSPWLAVPSIPPARARQRSHTLRFRSPRLPHSLPRHQTLCTRSRVFLGQAGQVPRRRDAAV